MTIERFTETEWRNLPETKGREKIRARYGFHYIQGNNRPYFVITADIVTRERIPHENRHTIDGKTFWDCGGGCCHEHIAKVFPELCPLIDWHLVDDNGSSMHYPENPLYWLRKHLGVFRLFSYSEPEGQKEGEPEPLSAFKSGIVFGSVDDDAKRLDAILETPEPEPETIPDLADFERREKAIIRAVSAWLTERLPMLDKRMRETMEAFEVPYIQENEYRSDGASLKA